MRDGWELHVAKPTEVYESRAGRRVCIEQKVSRTEERNFEFEDFLCTTM
jgi:hypothetical protein